MTLRKKLGRPVGGNVSPAGFTPTPHAQVIRPHVIISRPGAPERPSADNGIQEKKKGPRPLATGQDRPG